MVNLVQTAEVKTTVIAGLQRLGLGDAPVYKGVLLVFTAPCFIGGDTDIAVLSLPPDRLMAWNCFCGSLRMVVPIGDSLCVSPHF